jgi:murein L,D-transpeptidase YcbB/YkuD
MRSMMTSVAILILLPLLLYTHVYSVEKSSVHQFLAEGAGELIKIMLLDMDESSEVSLGGEQVFVTEMLERFYRNRNYQPAWMGNDGSFPHAETMLGAIEEVSNEGLMPDSYHFYPIRVLTEQLRKGDMLTPELIAELDVLLTDSFLMLGCQFSAGCDNPVTLQSEWFLNRNDLDVDLILYDALREGTVKENLREMLPIQTEYSRLRQKLLQYREVVSKGGWPTLSGEALIKKGSEGNTVTVLKKRLMISNDLDFSSIGEESKYDGNLERAVIRFQKRHGISADGIIGPETVRAMNAPAEQRLRQIEVNLERMRWISRNLGHRYVLVNIADFKLDVVEYGHVVLSMDVIVGKPFWNTPVFSKKMKYLILNPSWSIPESITKEELVPKIKNDPEYLTRHNMKIFRSWNRDAAEIPPDAIDWEDITAETFPYILRQEPGPSNPLGRIKFMLPNKFHVYLHDTPAKGRFAQNSRAFSHGCIRLQKPDDFAAYLLQDDLEWDSDKIRAVTEGDTRIDLVYPINVHIAYLTAWVDEAGVLQFRDDIYERDDRLYKALRMKPESISASLNK